MFVITVSKELHGKLSAEGKKEIKKIVSGAKWYGAMLGTLSGVMAGLLFAYCLAGSVLKQEDKKHDAAMQKLRREYAEKQRQDSIKILNIQENQKKK